jgi:hypothetical protein
MRLGTKSDFIFTIKLFLNSVISITIYTFSYALLQFDPLKHSTSCSSNKTPAFSHTDGNFLVTVQ